MNAVVVDTDVISYFVKRDSRAALYEQHLTVPTLFASFMTVAELDRWVLARNWGSARRNNLSVTLDHFIIHYPDRVLCRMWGEISERVRKKGFSTAPADAWIAATALFLNCPLVTHNKADFENIED